MGVVLRVREDRRHPRESDSRPLVQLDQLTLVLPLTRAVLAAAEHQHHRVVALQAAEPVHDAVLVGQLEVGQGHARP
jgi:hypothetical protein